VELLEARERPDWIVHGARYYEVILDPATFVMTIYQVEVLEVFRELAVFHDTQIAVGDIIEVARFGGAYGGYYYFVDGGFELQYGAEYVLFLERHWELPNFFYTLSNLQGAYRVPNVIASDEDLVEYGNISLGLETAADEDFGLTLTIEDLIDIAEENGLLEHDYLTFEEALAYASDVVIVQYMEASITVDGVIKFRFMVLESMLNETTDNIFVSLSDDGRSHFNFSEEGEYLLPLIRTESNDSTIEENVFIFIQNIVIDLINPSNSTMYGESIFEHTTDFNQEMTREEILSFINEHVIE